MFQSILRSLPIALVFTETLVYLSNDMYLAGVLRIGHDLQITQSEVALSMTVWFIGSSVMQLVVGGIADRFSKRKLILFGNILFGLSTFWSAVTASLSGLLFSRFLQGSTVGFIVVVGYSLIHKFYCGRVAVAILSVMQGVTIVAPAFGPILGAFIIKYYSWRLVFIFLCAVNLISFFWNIFAMPRVVLVKNKSSLCFKDILRDYLGILGNFTFLRFLCVVCLRVGAMIFWILESPFLIMSFGGSSELTFGIIQLLVCTGFPLGVIITRAMLNDNCGVNSVIKTGLWIGLGGACVLLFDIFDKYNLLYLTIGMFAINLGSGMSGGSLNRAAVEVCDSSAITNATAIISSLISFTGVLSGFIATIVTDLSFVGFAFIMLFLTSLSTIVYMLGKPAVVDESVDHSH